MLVKLTPDLYYSSFSSLTVPTGEVPDLKIPVKSFLTSNAAGSLLSFHLTCWIFQFSCELIPFSSMNCCSWVMAVNTPPRGEIWLRYILVYKPRFFLIRKRKGRQIKDYNMKHNLEHHVKHKTALLNNLVTINSCWQFGLTLFSNMYFDLMYHV